MMTNKPYAESCEQNRQPIFQVLQEKLGDTGLLLEIGSGTGQHAIYFAPEFPNWSWQTSDREENHAGMLLWLEEAALDNIKPPLALDVEQDSWPQQRYDAVFSANTSHIMPMSAVEKMFQGVSQCLQPEGQFILYGPFMYDGQHTSESNQRFDLWLRDQAAHQGVRDMAWLKQIAKEVDLVLAEDIEMPVNNRILIWQKG